jgi:dolichol-phosphate mannosyltransferase
MIVLSIIVPTFNEISNVRELHNRISACCADINWEMIFVDDDSPDGTSAEVCLLANEDSRVRIVHRIGRRGLTSACLEGMLASSAALVAVIDADLQHDEALLPKMFEMLSADAALDIVVGSRYTDQGSIGNWNASRAFISRLATRLGSMVLKADLKDPMSGFFMIRRSRAIQCLRNGMSGIGFKILLDLFASSPNPLRFKEIPFEFRNRFSGQSKLDTTVVWEYLIVLAGHLLGGIIPVRFIAFSLVGGLGVLIHLMAFSTLFKVFGVSFVNSQIVATLVAMTCNFMLNNILTYRDLRLRGSQLLTGWLSFSLACSLGAIANVSLSQWIFEEKPAHWILAVLPGILVAAVWNYAVTSVYTWKKPRVS